MAGCARAQPAVRGDDEIGNWQVPVGFSRVTEIEQDNLPVNRLMALVPPAVFPQRCDCPRK